jgi:histidinol-phosphate/aromatic aminotransferase/cobyric acid decarboxylase-like protein
VIPELLERVDLREWAKAVDRLRADLVALLREHALTAESSDANFVLVTEAGGLRDHLARHAVLVRDTSSFGYPHGVRIAVPDERGLDRLADALKGWFP